MKKSLLILTVLILATTACVAQGRQRWLSTEEHETIRKTLTFASGNATKVLEVDNVTGSIRVTGYDGRDVEMVVEKTIRAQSQNRLDAAKREVSLDIMDKAETINIFVDQPGHERSTSNSGRSHWDNRGYDVAFDFEIRVPRQTEVHLWTVNEGDILVDDVRGDFDVNNVNGGIEMSGLMGSGRAHTINGRVKVAFASNPKEGSHFDSINGNIEVTFQRNLSADLRYKTLNGGVYTDFQVSPLPATANPPERRNGKLIFKSQSQGVRVGNGGPVIEFEGFNGNVRILQAK